MGQNNPNKMFYRAGEVSQMIGVESYVLRYWEKMFPQLNPERDETGQRIYTKSDIDLVRRIKTLLYEERYTIDGARKRLKGERKNKAKNSSSEDNQELLAALRDVRGILREISSMLEEK